MSADSYIGTMRPFGGTFTIRSWTVCQGQLLAVAENTALFSILGDLYGGDARTSFGIPDLRGRSPLGEGRIPGGSLYSYGQRAGAEFKTLTLSQLPTHDHAAVFSPTGGSQAEGILQAATNPGNTTTPSADTYLAASADTYYKQVPLTPAPTLVEIPGLTVEGGGVTGNVTVGTAGHSEPFSIVGPYQVVNWQMVIEGLYPSRA